jgi:hypothetical protein
VLGFLMPAVAALSVASVAAVRPAAAQGFDPSGRWYCTVNAQSNDPAGNWGLEVEMAVTPDGRLLGRGAMYYPQLANAVQPMQGHGDWSVLPDEGSGPLFKYRLQTQTHGIVTWYVHPADAVTMYNLFRNQDPSTGVTAAVETRCMKTG